MNKSDRWIYVKNEMCEATKDYAKSKASENNLIISQLSEKVHEMETNLIFTNKEVSEKEMDLYSKTKCDLEELIQEKTRGFHIPT